MARVVTERVNYGGYPVVNWHLETEAGLFYMGQAEKVCARILGKDSETVARELSEADNQVSGWPCDWTPYVQETLAAWILDCFGLLAAVDDEMILADVDAWSFAV